jgi:hypothetical protein
LQISRPNQPWQQTNIARLSQPQGFYRVALLP